VKPRRIFHDEDEKPAFEFSVCVFMDVLGFKDLQKHSFTTDDAALAEFKRFYGVIRSELESMNQLRACLGTDQPLWELKAFTDNIALGFPIRGHVEQHAESEIGRAASSIAGYQLAMAREGYFVRGGLSVGDLFMDEYLAYGPAFLEAYRVESEIARDPRIVVCPETRSLIEKHFTFYSQPQHAPQNKFFLLDSDGQVFVHYLAECFQPWDEGVEIDEESLGIHKQHIEKRLVDFAGNPRIWPKYDWLAKYHDYTVSEGWPGVEVDSSLRVDQKLHRIAPARLCPFLVPSRNAEGAT
jgi:hypothetical protein